MPQLILQYTANIDQEISFQDLFVKLHNILADIGGIKIDNCKSRAFKLDNYYIGRGETSNAFINLDIHFLEGRPQTLKKEIGSQILEALKEIYSQSISELNLQITVEIKDIERDVYFKYPPGSLK
ncbi:5-carboxymethyl-2-hydroxymuconate Delta-isomerase [candidate division KSB1 bacterium]|nr:5-carboxymethyl-2-hydroxymuconate Delta-isomerase [candidate division KSB1 bacterium]